jgi:hypothetical protein
VTSVEFDMSQVTRFAARIPRAEVAMVAPLAAVVETTAAAIQKDLRSKARGVGHAPSFPSSITHDIRGLSAEIGPDKNRRQGALGNLLYFGSVNNAPVLEHPSAALARARPAFEAAVVKVAGDGLEKGLGQ